MLQPAILYKEELSKSFSRKLYTQEYFWYEGSIENYEREIKEEADKFQFAIVESGQILGFISFRVDWYCTCAYNFGLIKFLDTYFDNITEECKSSIPKITSAIREVIQMLRSFKLHRIDFRCVDGNPAEKKYYKIIYSSVIDQEYYTRVVRMVDNIKDVYGEYHDTLIYELIRRGE